MGRLCCVGKRANFVLQFGYLRGLGRGWRDVKTNLCSRTKAADDCPRATSESPQFWRGQIGALNMTA